MFACENASEGYDLNLTFKDQSGQTIAKIKFQYFHDGLVLPTDWLLKIFYYDPIDGWMILKSGYPADYLRKGWYKLRIEKINPSQLNYSLYRGTNDLVDYGIANKLTASLSSLKEIKFTSTYDALNCPMFIWDEHKIDLY